MSIYTLNNDSLVLQFDDFGGELTSIFGLKKNVEYLWNADPLYWKRHSPILFPFIGNLKDQSFTHNGQTYYPTSHGFARDMTFSFVSKTENELWFSLEATEETKEVYPFDFRLESGYRLEDRKITVMWRVINRDESTMHFSIGGHPAFNCPLLAGEEQFEYYIHFDSVKPLRYLHIDENGLVKKLPRDKQNLLTTDHGLLPIDEHMFDYNALIIEDQQCHSISLLDPFKIPYVTVTFDAPVVGIWSPKKQKAPFICIEPWYGRCDANDFSGTLADRDWSNSLSPGAIFEASYTIEIGR